MPPRGVGPVEVTIKERRKFVAQLSGGLPPLIPFEYNLLWTSQQLWGFPLKVTKAEKPGVRHHAEGTDIQDWNNQKGFQMSALITLEMKTEKTVEEINAFAKGFGVLNLVEPSTPIPRSWRFKGEPNMWLKLSNKNWVTSCKFGFALLDWDKNSDMLLQIEEFGVFARRDGRLIVSPGYFRERSDESELLRGRTFEFSNAGPWFSDLLMQDESWWKELDWFSETLAWCREIEA